MNVTGSWTKQCRTSALHLDRKQTAAASSSAMDIVGVAENSAWSQNGLAAERKTLIGHLVEAVA